ncbi:MAG: efflux RND transporter periplasmic adaptor subunit, partial [Acetobacteraceae bacterium]|nr:efflux RND transporter periplasmic adaptor subunit [Acetobacteraceae bacterium]
MIARRILLAASMLAWASASAAPNQADPAVPVFRPTSARITRYLETTGTVAAMQSVDLVARVSGTLESIDVADGAIVKKGTTVFVIEPLPYESKLRQMQAAEDQQRALVVQADAEYARQAQLVTSSASSKSQVDSALATRDSARAALKQAEEATRQAAITYAYTRVTAPFDGVVTAHLVSAGELVGSGSPTKLASIMQLDPIWVNANISEADVLRARAAMAAKGKTIRDLGTVPVEAALAGDTGYPH